MQEIMHFPHATAIPSRETVLRAQGIPEDATVPKAVASLLDDGFEIYSRTIDPAGIRVETSIEEFGEIFLGEGRNASSTPLEDMVPNARRLALFAVTIGEEICAEIRKQFSDGDVALGYGLDTIASAGAEKLMDAMALDYQENVLQSNPTRSEVRVLAHSPGYCGWHVSGQRKLFEVLRPDRIGISLNPTHLMQPSKSVSGVLVAADREIHEFDIGFDFCADCTDQNCRERIQSVLFDL